jgi:RhoGAP domain
LFLNLLPSGLFVEGIFRLSGSARRIGELQHLFDIPPLYGSQLDWQGYSIHDAANVLRRFLNSLPDPVITHKSYNDFRNVLGELARIGD